MRRWLPLLVAAAAAATACGDDDDPSEVVRTVREFVTASNERDADALCHELMTQELVEQTTGATGDGARDACKEQLAVLRRPRLRLEHVGRVRIDGERASVATTLETGGQAQPRVFNLEKEDGDWRLAGAPAG